MALSTLRTQNKLWSKKYLLIMNFNLERSDQWYFGSGTLTLVEYKTSWICRWLMTHLTHKNWISINSRRQLLKSFISALFFIFQKNWILFGLCLFYLKKSVDWASIFLIIFWRIFEIWLKTHKSIARKSFNRIGDLNQIRIFFDTTCDTTWTHSPRLNAIGLTG